MNGLEAQPNFESHVDPRGELASAAELTSSPVHAALVIAGVMGYAGYIWLAARRGRQDDIELVALAWLPLLITLARYSSGAFRSMAWLLRQCAVAILNGNRSIFMFISKRACRNGDVDAGSTSFQGSGRWGNRARRQPRGSATPKSEPDGKLT